MEDMRLVETCRSYLRNWRKRVPGPRWNVGLPKSADFGVTQTFPGTRGIGNCLKRYGHYDGRPHVVMREATYARVKERLLNCGTLTIRVEENMVRGPPRSFTVTFIGGHPVGLDAAALAGC